MAKRNFELNESFFDDIDSEEKAYTLGLIYSDGCNDNANNRFIISLNEKDREILEVLNKFFFADKPLLYRKKYVYKYGEKIITSNPQYKLQVCSKRMSNRLIELGVMPNKSQLIRFPLWMNTYITRHFIRGYFDGDGCLSCYKNDKKRIINKYRILILSNRIFCEEMALFIEGAIGLNPIVRTRKDQNISSLEVNGNNNVNKFCDFIYRDANIFIRRKHDIYENLKNELAEKKNRKHSKYDYVSFAKNCNKWYSYIPLANRTHKTVGYFDTELEAYEALKNTAPVYNEAIADGKRIKIFHVDKMTGLGTPEELIHFEANHESA